MLNQQQRLLILKQIDVGPWKHSWHLPSDHNGVMWNDLKTLTSIRDVLVDQITEARNTIREADKCLTIAVHEMIKLEQRASNDDKEL